MDNIENRLDIVESRIDSVEKRLEPIETKLNDIDEKVLDLIFKFYGLAAIIKRDFNVIDNTFDCIDAKINAKVDAELNNKDITIPDFSFLPSRNRK